MGGKPVKGYHPVHEHKINFLDITNDAATLRWAPEKEPIQFWNHILRKAEALIR